MAHLEPRDYWFWKRQKTREMEDMVGGKGGVE